MTHDELLATIDWIGHTKNGEAGTATNLGVAVLASLNALRAVVKLHKPMENNKCICQSIFNPWEDDDFYPCPTIQAIEKELE